MVSKAFSLPASWTISTCSTLRPAIQSRALAKQAASTCAKTSATRTSQSNFAVLTTPCTIYKDMIIVGFRAPETHPAPHGDIRAYDVHTGKLRWSFHTIPHPGEPGYQTWPKDTWKTAGAANNWAGMVVDRSAASSSPQPDRQSTTSTVQTVSATTSTPTRCSRSTPTLVSSFGIFREFTTTSGTAISPRRRFS